MKKVILWGILIFIGYKLYQKYQASLPAASTTAAPGTASTASASIMAPLTNLAQALGTPNPGSIPSGNLLDPVTSKFTELIY